MSQRNEKAFAEIRIPTQLYKQVEQRIKGTEFDSVSSYVAFVLRELLSDEEPEHGLSPEEEEMVKDRLKALGYID